MNGFVSSRCRIQPRHIRRIVVCAASLTLLLLSACKKSTVVVLVRHAEPGAVPPGDPALSPAGVARAQALVEVVRRIGLSAVFHTQLARTTETADTVATALNLPRIEISVTSGQEQAHADSVKNHILNVFAGQSVLVVGHSNTVPLIMSALGVSNPPAIGLQEFDNLFVVIRLGSNDPVRLLQGQYGQ